MIIYYLRVYSLGVPLLFRSENSALQMEHLTLFPIFILGGISLKLRMDFLQLIPTWQK